MRRELTKGALRELMEELARTAPAGESFRVYVVGGGTAVLAGWRSATIHADLHAEREEVFRDIQGIKRRLQLNKAIPESEYARYPNLSPDSVAAAVDDFLSGRR